MKTAITIGAESVLVRCQKALNVSPNIQRETYTTFTTTALKMKCTCNCDADIEGKETSIVGVVTH